MVRNGAGGVRCPVGNVGSAGAATAGSRGGKITGDSTVTVGAAICSVGPWSSAALSGVAAPTTGACGFAASSGVVSGRTPALPVGSVSDGALVNAPVGSVSDGALTSGEASAKGGGALGVPARAASVLSGGGVLGAIARVGGGVLGVALRTGGALNVVVCWLSLCGLVPTVPQPRAELRALAPWLATGSRA